jgi:uncharacterized protein (TIGR02271 family)
VTADAVKSAPTMAGEHLDPADEEALRRHYGLAATPPVAPPPVDLGAAGSGPRHAAPGYDSPERTTPVEAEVETGNTAGSDAAGGPDDGAMTRSEEQLRVGTDRVATTRARLVKYVVTEDVQITVPIRREEIRVEQVPLDAVDDEPGESLVSADADSPSTGLPEEIVLHTERPVVTVEVVPVERVRLRVDLVEGQETVTEQVQRERIVVDETPSRGVSSR